jgi:hypothetical protein
MKRLALILAVTGTLAACSSTPSVQKQAEITYDRQVAAAKQSIDQAPEWMFNLPKDPNMVYESATSISSDFSMADMKAKTIAYAKICSAAGGKVRSQTKIYRADNDAASVEQSEMAIRSICPDVDITGVQTIQMKHVAEGTRIRSYVLVGLPIGSANVLKSTKDAQARAPGAFKELDEVTGNKPASEAPAAPASKADGITLLPVDNADYKAKRDAALQKDGAVIGQTTVR